MPESLQNTSGRLLLSSFYFLSFFQRALSNFIAKIFFVKQIQSSGGVLQKTYVLNILQNASENLCIGVFSFNKVAK